MLLLTSEEDSTHHHGHHHGHQHHHHHPSGRQLSAAERKAAKETGKALELRKRIVEGLRRKQEEVGRCRDGPSVEEEAAEGRQEA